MKTTGENQSKILLVVRGHLNDEAHETLEMHIATTYVHNFLCQTKGTSAMHILPFESRIAREGANDFIHVQQKGVHIRWKSRHTDLIHSRTRVVVLSKESYPRKLKSKYIRTHILHGSKNVLHSHSRIWSITFRPTTLL